MRSRANVLGLVAEGLLGTLGRRAAEGPTAEAARAAVAETTALAGKVQWHGVRRAWRTCTFQLVSCRHKAPQGLRRLRWYSARLGQLGIVQNG